MSTTGRRPTLATLRTAPVGRRLKAHMDNRGWHQAELARRASAYLPKSAADQRRNKKVGRDTIWLYVIGRIFANPVYLKALAKALEVTQDELVPTKLDEPPRLDEGGSLSIQDMSNGKSRIEIDFVVPTKTAWAIWD